MEAGELAETPAVDMSGGSRSFSLISASHYIVDFSLENVFVG